MGVVCLTPKDFLSVPEDDPLGHILSHNVTFMVGDSPLRGNCFTYSVAKLMKRQPMGIKNVILKLPFVPISTLLCFR